MATERTDHKGEILLSIPSQDKYIYLLDLVVSYASKEMDFDEETAEQVNLAIIEAGTNAIRHGNKNDPEKTAQFRFQIAQDRLTVFVKDCGPGFDPEDVGDPLSPENFMKPSGRGIFLMKALMDEVEYRIDKGSGTEVRLVKYKDLGG
jgi:serine/threonine-protein kinase RsbW